MRRSRGRFSFEARDGEAVPIGKGGAERTWVPRMRCTSGMAVVGMWVKRGMEVERLNLSGA